MSDGPLTREEIRRAARAVQWEETFVPATMMWFTGWSPDGDPEERFAHTLSPEGIVIPNDEALWGGDALALLQATGETCPILLRPDGSARVVIPPKDDYHEGVGYDGPDLPAAAVRAVNLWHEKQQTPGAEPREGGEG